MSSNQTSKKDIFQVYDFHLDREYYKAGTGLFSSDRKVRTDRLKDWKEWRIECDEMPDKVIINGKEYKLTL